MITRITEGLVSEVRPHHFETDASDLQWPPGVVPPRLDTSMGNGQPLHVSHADGSGWMYRQQLGCITLKVFND